MTVRTRWQRCGIPAAALLLAAPDAFACSPIIRQMSRAQVEDYARVEYAEATAVVDAEVDLPMSFRGIGSGVMPLGTLRIIRSYKGGQSPNDIISVIYFSSCDTPFMLKGERVRVLLMGGPDIFRADQLDNGPAVEREGVQAEFNAEIDRLAGTPRPADFSVYPGAVDQDADYSDSQSDNAAMKAASPLQKPHVQSAKAGIGIGVYIAGALSVLLAFVAGFLTGRRRRPAPA